MTPRPGTDQDTETFGVRLGNHWYSEWDSSWFGRPGEKNRQIVTFVTGVTMSFDTRPCYMHATNWNQLVLGESCCRSEVKSAHWPPRHFLFFEAITAKSLYLSITFMKVTLSHPKGSDSSWSQGLECCVVAPDLDLASRPWPATKPPAFSFLWQFPFFRHFCQFVKHGHFWGSDLVGGFDG